MQNRSFPYWIVGITVGFFLGSFSVNASERAQLLKDFDRTLESHGESTQPLLENPIYHRLREHHLNRRVSAFKFWPFSPKLKIKPSAGAAGQITGDEFPKRTWALTFDDGPLSVGGGVTVPVVDELQKRGLFATFFMVASMLDADVVSGKYVRSHRMEIGNHSYTHAHLIDASVDVDYEIGSAKSVIQSQLKKTVTLFRFPYGEGHDHPVLRKKVAVEKMVSVLWNVDSLDWADSDPASITKRTVAQIQAKGNQGGIILFHDIHPQTLQASAQVMDYLKAKKMKICSVERVIAQINSGKACDR